MIRPIFKSSRDSLFLLLILSTLSTGIANAGQPPLVVRHVAPMETIVVRLRPGDDVYERLNQIAGAEEIEAGCVLACAGSMRKVALRFANQPKETNLDGKYEIVSLSGTLSRNGSHLHASVSDTEGKTIGGHLVTGGEVFTTVEIVIGILPKLTFQREHDPESGYRELIVRERKDTTQDSK